MPIEDRDERNAYYREYHKKRREANQAMLTHIKTDTGCSVCGYNRCARALHFHHKDPKTKSFCVGECTHRSTKQLLAEVAKCIILCANCHAEEHYNE